jgi:hypothetical protein
LTVGLEREWWDEREGVQQYYCLSIGNPYDAQKKCQLWVICHVTCNFCSNTLEVLSITESRLLHASEPRLLISRSSREF